MHGVVWVRSATRYVRGMALGEGAWLLLEWPRDQGVPAKQTAAPLLSALLASDQAVLGALKVLGQTMQHLAPEVDSSTGIDDAVGHRPAKVRAQPV